MLCPEFLIQSYELSRKHVAGWVFSFFKGLIEMSTFKTLPLADWILNCQILELIQN